MNTQRLVASLCFALLCSSFFTWQINRHTSHPIAPAAIPVRTVLVAAKDLAAGETLTSASLTLVTLPAAQPLQCLFSKPEDVAGRVLLTPLSSGEPITLHELAPTGLASTIPNGMRAIALPATDPIESSSLLAPGNHIDVFVSYHSEAEGSVVSSLVLQDITVLASTQKGASGAEPRASTPATVNLLVTSEDAARLTSASALGKLTFALRNGTDKTRNTGLTHVTLTPERAVGPGPARSASQPTAEPRTKGFVVETLSGGKSSVQTFSEGGR